MGFARELYFDSIVMDVKVSSQQQLFEKLADHVSMLIGTPKLTFQKQLIEQEKKQSSTIGHGVFVPNACLPRLTRPMFIFLKLDKGIDCNAQDSELVDMVCLVLSPVSESVFHLRRIAKAARFLSDKEFLRQLRAAENKNDVQAALNRTNTNRFAA